MLIACTRKRMEGAEEMAQSMNYFLYKHGDLSLDPQYHVKKGA